MLVLLSSKSLIYIKNTILNISSLLSPDLDFPFPLSISVFYMFLQFHYVPPVCLILRILELCEFSHILLQDRRTGISDFTEICCTVLKKKSFQYKEYVPCQGGLLAIYFRMKNSSFLYCQVFHRKMQCFCSYYACLKICSVLNGLNILQHLPKVLVHWSKHKQLKSVGKRPQNMPSLDTTHTALLLLQ